MRSMPKREKAKEEAGHSANFLDLFLQFSAGRTARAPSHFSGKRRTRERAGVPLLDYPVLLLGE